AGIFGLVSLEVTPTLHLDNLALAFSLKGKKIRVEGELHDERDQNEDESRTATRATMSKISGERGRGQDETATPDKGSGKEGERLEIWFMVKDLGVLKGGGNAPSGRLEKAAYRNIGAIPVAEGNEVKKGNALEYSWKDAPGTAETSEIRKGGSARPRRPDEEGATCIRQGHFVFEADFGGAELWDIDRPYLYLLRVCLHEKGDEGNILDEVTLRFGCRELKAEGSHFLLNGRRVNFREASIRYDRGLTPDSLRRRIQNLREAHFNIVRFHSEPVPSWMLDVCDEEGMPVIDESAIYGSYVGRYDTSAGSKFWPQAQKHWRGLVKRDRNHPCVVIWSIENETIEYHAGRAGEVRFMELGLLVRQLDPTRPIMYEGGLDCFGTSDIINVHYPHEFPFWNCLPNDGWWLEQAMVKRSFPFRGGKMIAGRKNRVGRGHEPDSHGQRDPCTSTVWPRREWGNGGLYLDSLWRWQPEYAFRRQMDKPLWIGEALFMPSATADPYAIVLGDAAYTEGRGVMDTARALVWAYYLEAYRAAEVGGICPWVITGQERKDHPLYAACRQSFKPVAVFIRERNNRFLEGEMVTRTASIYNDEAGSAGRKDLFRPKGAEQGDDFRLDWRLAADDGTVQAKGWDIFRLQPGYKHDSTIRFRIPPLPQPGRARRERWHLCLQVSKNGLVRDEKEWNIYGYRRDTGKVSEAAAMPADRVYLYDPEGNTAGMLGPVGIAWTGIKTWRDLEARPAGLLILGRNSLAAMDGQKILVGGRSRWQEAVAGFVRRGGMVIALEQEFYPAWLPARISLNYLHQSTIAFCGQADHPVLRDMGDEEVCFWGRDHFVSRYDFHLPRLGNYESLVDSGGTGGLVYSPLIEIEEGDGRLLLCQMLVTEKWADEPVARVLFRNMIEYAAERLKQRLKGSGQEKVNDRNEAVRQGKADGAWAEVKIGPIVGRGKGVKVFEGGKDVWERFSREKDSLLDFVKKGGKVLIRGVNEDNIAWVRKVLPLDIRKMSREDLPIRVKEAQNSPAENASSSSRPIILYHRDLCWVEPHSEFGYNWAAPDAGIVEYCLHGPAAESLVDAEALVDIDGDFGGFTFTALTEPPVLLEVGYGRGFFLIDQVRWDSGEARRFHEDKGLRYATSILRHMGVRVAEGPSEDMILIQAENMSCRTPGQPLIRCRSHDYWTICSHNFIGQKVKFLRSGSYEATVRAKCRLPERAAVLGLMIDGSFVGHRIVSSPDWNYYTFMIKIDEGEHEIRLYLLNSDDPYGQTYLYLDRLEINRL
ncbi:MAG: glycoside hydrolase family 2 TIM barrel-domain containing protein, partial [bacterium]